MSTCKEFRNQLTMLTINIVETIKAYTSLAPGSALEFKKPLELAEDILVTAVDDGSVHVKTGTPKSLERWEFDDFSASELINILEQLEPGDYDTVQ